MKTIDCIKFLLIGACCLAACTGGRDDGDGPRDTTGRIQLAISAIPDGVRCLRVNAAAPLGAAAQRDYTVAAGRSFSRVLDGIPVGEVTFNGSAFDMACSDLAVDSDPSWIADEVATTVRPFVLTAVDLHMKRAGRVCLEVTFWDDFLCEPVGQSCLFDASCCSGVCLGGSCRPAEGGGPSDPICLLETEVGPCKARIPRWTYDADAGRCRRFIYGGCGGNANNFRTLEQCEAACREPAQPCQTPTCSLPADPGPCDAVFPRWYFNSDRGRCERFIYGGCQGNENNFQSKSACEDACPSACRDFQCRPGQTCELFEGRPYCADTCEGRRCPAGQVCELVPVQCVRAPCPPVARCVPDEPCVCPEVYAPVCGIDGTTYANACFARCARVEIAHEGECLPGCSCNSDCTGTDVCHQGRCQPACSISCLVPDPVCGVDGVTYVCGEPDAACHGVSVLQTGECGTACQDDADCATGGVCVPTSDCPSPCGCAAFCEPCFCPDVYDPVCGTDGTTYSNLCEARCAHVEVAHRGTCQVR